MAYAPYDSTSPNPPVGPIGQTIAFGSTQSTLTNSGAGGGRLWIYNSTHLQTDVGASDFISDGQDLGMLQDDIVFAVGASGLSIHQVTSVGSTFVSLTAGLLVSSAS